MRDAPFLFSFVREGIVKTKELLSLSDRHGVENVGS